MMVDKKQGALVGFLMLVSAFIGAGGHSMIDVQLYSCEDKGIVSDCVNGIKADGLRCYYNESNPYAYEYCSNGWEEYSPQVLNESSAYQVCLRAEGQEACVNVSS